MQRSLKKLVEKFVGENNIIKFVEENESLLKMVFVEEKRSLKKRRELG